MKTEAGNNIKEVLFKGNLPVAGWLPTDPPGHSRYNLISLLTWKNINLLRLIRKNIHPNTPLQFLFLISNLVFLLLLLAGAGCATRGEEALVDFPQVGKKKDSFDQFFDFLKRIIHTRHFTNIQHFCLSVRGASGLLPGEKKPHKTYRPVRETS